VGRGASGQASPAVTTTHAPLAGKVQRKLRNGVAQMAAAGSAEILAISGCASLADGPRRPPAEIPASTPELRLSDPAAQTRIVSVVTFGLSPGNLHDLSKG
jgi:hypothetical protein